MLIVSRRLVTSTVRGQACNKIHKVKTVSNFVKKEKLYFLAFANVNKVNKLIKTKMNFMSSINFSNFINLNHASKWAKITKNNNEREFCSTTHPKNNIKQLMFSRRGVTSAARGQACNKVDEVYKVISVD